MHGLGDSGAHNDGDNNGDNVECNDEMDEKFVNALLGLRLPFGGKTVDKAPKLNSQDSLREERQNLHPIRIGPPSISQSPTGVPTTRYPKVILKKNSHRKLE